MCRSLCTNWVLLVRICIKRKGSTGPFNISRMGGRKLLKFGMSVTTKFTTSNSYLQTQQILQLHRDECSKYETGR
jgi:hypothetical protein